MTGRLGCLFMGYAISFLLEARGDSTYFRTSLRNVWRDHQLLRGYFLLSFEKKKNIGAKIAELVSGGVYVL